MSVRLFFVFGNIVRFYALFTVLVVEQYEQLVVVDVNAVHKNVDKSLLFGCAFQVGFCEAHDPCFNFFAFNRRTLYFFDRDLIFQQFPFAFKALEFLFRWSSFKNDYESDVGRRFLDERVEDKKTVEDGK